MEIQEGEVNSMDNEKEGDLGTIAETAKTSMDAAIEGVSSVATSIAEAVAGTTEKPKRRKRRSTTKKATASRGRTTTRRAKAKRSTAGRRSAAATRRSKRKTAAIKNIERERVTAIAVSSWQGDAQQEGPPREALPACCRSWRSSSATVTLQDQKWG